MCAEGFQSWASGKQNLGMTFSWSSASLETRDDFSNWNRGRSVKAMLLQISLFFWAVILNHHQTTVCMFPYKKQNNVTMFKSVIKMNKEKQEKSKCCSVKLKIAVEMIPRASDESHVPLIVTNKVISCTWRRCPNSTEYHSIEALRLIHSCVLCLEEGQSYVNISF